MVMLTLVVFIIAVITAIFLLGRRLVDELDTTPRRKGVVMGYIASLIAVVVGAGVISGWTQATGGGMAVGGGFKEGVILGAIVTAVTAVITMSTVWRLWLNRFGV